jgi:hypothetical protein
MLRHAAKHMNRRFFLFRLLTIIFAADGVTANTSAAPSRLTADVLKATLAAKTPAEIKYCDTVIKLRDSGEISERVLSGVYRNAVSKDRNKRFVYFQRALENVRKQRSKGV